MYDCETLEGFDEPTGFTDDEDEIDRAIAEELGGLGDE